MDIPSTAVQRQCAVIRHHPFGNLGWGGVMSCFLEKNNLSLNIGKIYRYLIYSVSEYLKNIEHVFAKPSFFMHFVI